MKKYFNKLLIFLFMLTLIPTFVLAEVEEKEELKKEPIKIYEFYGNGCGYCAASLSFFESIEAEYGDYFDLVKYEVWESEQNNALMHAVAKEFGDEIKGVPYIIIGDYTSNGYSEEDNTILLQKIIDEYEKDEVDRDVKASNVIANFKYENTGPNILLVGVIVAVIVAVLAFIIIKAREE